MTDGVNEIVIHAKVVNKLTEPFYDTSDFHHSIIPTYILCKYIMRVLISTFLVGTYDAYIFDYYNYCCY